MHSSPSTPTGTGSIVVSRTYIRVFAIGRPMETTLFAIPSTRSHDDQIVVSVGP
jgi:hypothetical protein